MKLKLKDLQQRLEGHVTQAQDVLDYFSTDGSIFTIEPSAVVYPYNTKDVQQVVAYAKEQADQGKPIGVVARGKGTDQAGGAVGDGIMVVFPAHMNRLLRLDKSSVTFQPGIVYKDLQNTLHTHHRFLPPYPSSIDFSTLGGAVANNACGEKTLKYGSTRDYVKSLRVVLADGSVIETRRLSPRELSRKKGLPTFEGEIYRRLDGLIEDNKVLIERSVPHVSKNSAGYALWRVKDKDGYFDLSQVIVGAQGTLGIVTEATLKTVPFNPDTTLIVGFFNDLRRADQAILRLQKLQPSAMEIVDYYLLDFLKKHKPESIEGLIPENLPKIAILVEFDDKSKFRQVWKSRQAQRILKRYDYETRIAKNVAEQEALWRIRRSAAAVIWMTQGKQKALPVIEDGTVPVEKLPEFLDKTYKLLKKHKLEIAVWGHAGNADFHMQPFMDLSKAADRTKVLDLADEFYDMVIKMGGTTCGEHNDGLVRAPYLEKLYGKDMCELFRQTKQIFDPQNILNPGKKLDVKKSDLPKYLRQEYSMKHLYDHMPHT